MEKRTGKVKRRSNRWWWHGGTQTFEIAVKRQRADEIFKADLGRQAQPRRIISN